MNQQLQDYIKEARTAGMNDEQIRKVLLESGWSEVDINTNLESSIKPEKTSGMKKSLIVSIVIIIVLITSIIIGGLFLRQSRILNNQDKNNNLSEEIVKNEANVKNISVSPQGNKEGSLLEEKKAESIIDMEKETKTDVDLVDDEYGYAEKNPIKVGGAEKEQGPLNERKYIESLRGPNNEKIKYERAGSCCFFKTPNATIGDEGLLDQYEVSYTGIEKSVTLYLNMYDYGELKAPKGFVLLK